MNDLAEHQRDVEAEDVRHAIDTVAHLKAITAASLELLKQARADSKHSLSLRAVDLP